jgi:hypothetical protein
MTTVADRRKCIISLQHFKEQAIILLTSPDSVAEICYDCYRLLITIHRHSITSFSLYKLANVKFTQTQAS